MDNTRMDTDPCDPFEDEWAAPTPYGAHGENNDAAEELQDASRDNYNTNPIQNVRFTDSQRMPPPPKPTFRRTLSVRSEDMRNSSLQQRAQADAAFKAHQQVQGHLEDAIESQKGATAKLKEVERQVMNKRINISLLETKLTEQIADISEASDTASVYTVLFDAILIKIDDLQNDQEELHGLELDLAENLKVVSQVEVSTNRVRLAELRSKLHARRAKLEVVEREAAVSAVESVLEDWAGVKKWASRKSSVESAKLEHLGMNIDPSLGRQVPPSKRRRQASAADHIKEGGSDVYQASPERKTLKRRLSNFMTDLPGYLGVL